MKNKGLYAVLLLSLAINVFLAGVTLGKGFGGDNRPSGPPRDFNMRALERYLDDDQRSQLLEGLHGQRSSIRATVRKLRLNEDAIRKVLSEEAVDKYTLTTLLKEHEDLIQSTRSPLSTVISNVVANFDWETRKAIAEDLFRKGGRDRLHPGPRGRFGPPPNEREDFDGPRRRDAHPPPEHMDGSRR